jgi:hypothetical protein
MENGGNAKAAEYFKKYGIRSDPSKQIDYKSSGVQKYKQELTKKIDQMIESQNPQVTTTT